MAIAESQPARHLKYCRPYCSHCYYTSFCRFNTTRWRGRHGPDCQLGPKQTKIQASRDIELASAELMNRNYAGRGYHRKAWTLCRPCTDATPAERVRAMETRDAGEAYRLARLPLTCEGCNILLPEGGPRWWVCGMCLCECPSSVHPCWGG